MFLSSLLSFRSGKFKNGPRREHHPDHKQTSIPDNESPGVARREAQTQIHAHTHTHTNNYVYLFKLTCSWKFPGPVGHQTWRTVICFFLFFKVGRINVDIYSQQVTIAKKKKKSFKGGDS